MKLIFTFCALCLVALSFVDAGPCRGKCSTRVSSCSGVSASCSGPSRAVRTVTKVKTKRLKSCSG